MNRRGFFRRAVGGFAAAIGLKLTPGWTQLTANDLANLAHNKNIDDMAMGILRQGTMTFEMHFPPATALLESQTLLPIGTLVSVDIDGRVRQYGLGDRILGAVVGGGSSIDADGLTTHHLEIQLDDQITPQA